MKKLLIAFVAGFMSLAVAGAYAADDKKGDSKKSDTGMSKSDKGMAKSADAGAKDDDKDKKKSKKDDKK
jgi:hypothetical protein